MDTEAKQWNLFTNFIQRTNIMYYVNLIRTYCAVKLPPVNALHLLLVINNAYYNQRRSSACVRTVAAD